MRPRPLVAITLALGLTVSACAGPKKPFELGLREVPSDLLLGNQDKGTPLPAQMPPTAFLVTDLAGSPPPRSPVSTLPPPVPEPPPPPPACPEADPLAPAKLPALTDIPKPPVRGTYQYRTSGTLVDPAGPRTLAPTAVHDVGNVVSIGPGEFTFDVTVRQDDRLTTTTYHVVPRTSPAVPPGLYIARVDSGGGLPPFAPKPELLLLPFPALRGTTFNGAGSDGATTIEYDGLIDETERVDACGAHVDGLQVKLTNGRATTARTVGGTSFVEAFEATYVIATQYGGLSLRDFFKGGAPTGQAARELRGIISQVPGEPVG